MNYKQKRHIATLAGALRISAMYAQKQGLNFYELGMIALLQYRRERMFEDAELLRLDRDLDLITQIAADIRDLEFQLQKWWHFSPRPHMHSWWCRIPHCECDNNENNKRRQALTKGAKESWGSKQKINTACPLHGKGTGFSLEKGFKEFS
jgi:hypothetical protein